MSMVVALAATARAQSATTGAVQGQVTDEVTGEPLAGVTVWITGPATPEPQTAITEGDGTYKVTELLPGTYQVTFYAGDTTVTRTHIRVTANGVTPVFQRVRLDPEHAGTVIEIEDVPPQIDPTSTTRGSTQDRTFIERVPTPGRGFEGAAGTQPGTHDDGVGLAVSGSSSLENRYLVDGVDITGLTYGTVGTPILSELIEQVEVIAGGYNAEWGRATGGIVNVITKSGTNALRGSVFGTLTPGFLARSADATPTETSSIDIESRRAYQTDFGVELGGPLIRDRAFFFVGFAPQLARTDHTRITRRRTDCRTLLDSGEMSSCDPRFLGQGGFADGVADVDPATGFHITDEIDREVRRSTARQYTAIGKLNLAVTPAHQAQLSVIAVPTSSEAPGLEGLASSGQRARGLTTDAALRWTSKLDDGRTELEALVAWHRSTRDTGSIAPALDGEPLQLLHGGTLGTLAGLGGETAATQRGCTDGGPDDPYPGIANCPMDLGTYAIGGPGALARDREERRMGRVGLTHRIGGHELRVGADVELNAKQIARVYSGGAFLRNYIDQSIEVTRWVELAPPEAEDPRFDRTCVAEDADAMPGGGGPRTFACDYLDGTPGAPGTLVHGSTVNWSAYLRDSWRLRPNLTLNAGLRYEEQRLRYASNLRGTTDVLTGNLLGTNALVLDGNVAPRVGVIWDPTERGASKVFAAWGRFFEAIPMNINDRAFGNEASYVQTYALGADQPCGPRDPRIGGPDGRGCLDTTARPTQEQLLGSSGVLIAPGLRAQYMDELLAGIEYQLARDLKLGVTYQHRRLGRVIEDLSTDGAQTYIIANPGEWSEDAERELEERIARTADDATRARLERELRMYRGIRSFDRPERSYDALEVSLSRRFARGLFVQASYTYARTEGNYPGLISYDNGQVDPNISSQYDLIELLGNRHGRLPQDRPHSVKIDGHYTYALGARSGLTIGGRFRALSGVPRNALGAHAVYGADESFLLPRGSMGRTPFVHTLDLHVAYGRRLSKTVSAELYVDVFNVYDQQTAATLDDTYAPTFRQGGGENNVNPISGGAYEDLIFAKALDARGTETPLPTARNPNFGKPLGRYPPTSARVGFRVTF